VPNGIRLSRLRLRRVRGFIRQAQRLGFTLDEVKEIVAIKRAGRVSHVRELVRRKADALDVLLKDLMEIRNGLRSLVGQWRSSGHRKAAVCPHIESSNGVSMKRHQPKGESQPRSVRVPSARNEIVDLNLCKVARVPFGI